ncbi:hypothetical protein PENTCL1PPCAC_15565, partial [Pristionchus entomophagus]
MFTTRICCCSATVASQIAAVIAILLNVAVACSNWFSDPPLPLFINIYQSVLVGLVIIACVLVFVACCSLQPSLILPIIVIQVWSILSLIGTGIWVLIELWYAVLVWEIILYIVIYLIAILTSLFVLHCHVCCYKLLLMKRR